MRAMHIKALTVSMRGKSTVAINDILYEAQKIFDTEKNPSMPLINTMLVAFATALRPAKTLQFFNDIKLKYHVRSLLLRFALLCLVPPLLTFLNSMSLPTFLIQQWCKCGSACIALRWQRSGLRT